MKKILFALAIALMATVSCGKQNTDVDSRLVGASFFSSGYSNILGPTMGIYGHIYKFTDAYHGSGIWLDENKKQVGDTEGFTYILDYPNLSITNDKPGNSGIAKTYKYVFTDPNTFVELNDKGEQNKIATYYKQ